MLGLFVVKLKFHSGLYCNYFNTHREQKETKIVSRVAVTKQLNVLIKWSVDEETKHETTVPN